MVKTRHSDELSVPTLPPQNRENGPQFMSLNNERLRRYSTRAADEAGDSLHISRAYTEGSNAFNIFEDKVVDSRLRPRTGPSRAYNYLDADSSEEESQHRSRHRSGRLGFSPDRHADDSGRSLRHRQVKQELLDDDRTEQQRGKRSSRLHLRRRDLSPGDDSDGTEHDDMEANHDQRISRRTRCHSTSEAEQHPGLKERGVTKTLRRRRENEDESEKESQLVRRVASAPRQQARQEHQSSDEDQETQAGNLRTRRSLRQQEREDEHDDDNDEDEETEHVRRSSRKRRQVFDTLNQSYLVSLPGKQKQNTDMHNDNEDTKDEDSDENKKEFSDMYSRVKRKRIRVKRNMYGVPISEDSNSEEEDQDENTNNNQNDDEDDEEEEEEDEENGDEGNQSRRVLRTRRSIRRPKPQNTVKSYSLRQHKPRTDHYKAPVAERRVRRVDNSVFAHTPTKNNPKQPYQSPAHRRNIRKRSALHSSSSSTSSSDSESNDEKNFKRRKAKSMAKARNRMMPMNMTADALASASVLKDRVKSGVSLADVEPMTIDKSVTFDSIGGLGKHIRKLKEMVVFPLLYDNVFQRFKVDPPRGVLFYGPPGTGKTLVARALANECSQGDKRVAFFMRKGADCLSKWVGESERQLRLLFDQAYKFRPSIIFFDEIDGLAPVRSSRQDQIHSSIVSTLLALMDGLDSRGEIVVIGATNRIDSLDPALRRPGRFDREFLFPLPSLDARKQILKIHTSGWNPRLNDHFLSELAEKCVGYCGADLKALCTEAAMQALRRRYPQIYLTNEALQLDVSSINVSAKDFFNAIASIIPTSQRSVNTPARALAPRVAALLQPQLDSVMDKLGDIFPASLADGCPLDNTATLNQAKQLADNGIAWEELLSDEDEEAPSIFIPSTSAKDSKALRAASSEDKASSLQPAQTYMNFISYATRQPTTFRPRLMLVGCEGQGQTTHLAPAVVHQMENLPVHVLDLPTLYAVTAKTPEESCANVFHEAKRKCPSILYLPYMDQWWDVMADTLRATLLTLIHDLDPALPLLLLATSERPYHMLDPTLRSLFSTYSCEVIVMRNPNKEERNIFFKDLLLSQAFKPPPQKKQAEAMLKLVEITKQPTSNGSRKQRKGKKRRSKQDTPLPSFIYPFGRHEDSIVQSSNKLETSAKPENVLKSEEKSKANLRMAGTVGLRKSQEAMAKLANLKLRLRDLPSVQTKASMKPLHHMVLRRRVKDAGGLNSNQSARDSGLLRNSSVNKSSFPAPLSDRFGIIKKASRSAGRICKACKSSGQIKVRTMTTRTRATTLCKPSSSSQEKSFKKPSDVPLPHNVQKKASTSVSKVSMSKKSWDRLSIELTSRQQRYLRRLQRLEVKMSEIATNSHPSCSTSIPHLQASYCALSARHLRYLSRLRKIDAALYEAKSHCFVEQSSSYFQRRDQHRPASDLSCGSFQMLYKKKDESHGVNRNLSLPVNLRELAVPRKQNRSGSLALKGAHRTRGSQNMTGKAIFKRPYNLRKKRGSGSAQRMLESLPLAAAPKPRDLSQEELALLVEKEELTLMELRIFLRDVLNKLGTDKKFSIFAKPVDIEDAADYYDIIETPMDLSSMMAKIDLHEYSTVRDFLNDIDLICSNALEYNPDRGPMDRVIRHRACALKDTAYAIIKTELDKEFEKMCVDIQESRRRRGEKSGTVPNFYNTRLKHGNSSRSQSSAVPSYLDKPQITRSIPKPDGERFSRRVRGLETDPVPPLEVVEKVAKSNRSGASPSREDKPSTNHDEDADSTAGNKEGQLEEDEEDCDHDASNGGEQTQTPGGKDDSCKADKEEKSNNSTLSTGNPSTSKKKRPLCVWCRPRRKKPRLALSKPGAKPGTSEKKADEKDEEDENEEMSEGEEDGEDSERKQDPSENRVDQQLAIDSSEAAGRSSTGKRSRSPASAGAVPCGVSTRRSSMSPRMAAASPEQQQQQQASQSMLSPAMDSLREEKPDLHSSSKDSTQADSAAADEKTNDDKTKALLAPTGKPTEQSHSLPPRCAVDEGLSGVTRKSGVKDRSSVVKRLDLDMVITDSGHGSSLESNGDSRDSTDHKQETKGPASCPISKALPAIEALVNSNHNCSSKLRTTAAAILAAPSHTVVADVPRMTQLLTRLVGRTEGYAVERLEKIYSQLSQLVYRHRHSYDRSPMMEAMERKVEDLTQTMPGTSKQ